MRENSRGGATAVVMMNGPMSASSNRMMCGVAWGGSGVLDGYGSKLG